MTAIPRTDCEFCEGVGFTTGRGMETCVSCGGSGYVTLRGDLGPTHSAPRRPFSYTPATRTLTFFKGHGKTAFSYGVSEFAPKDGLGGRCFLLAKADRSDTHVCRIGAQEPPSCTCAGKTYVNTEKANLRSWLRGDKEFESLGCRHLDAVRVLIAGGWLDPPEHVPAEPRND